MTPLQTIEPIVPGVSEPRDTARKALSPAKLAANRSNAKKSTGPRTEEGKRRSSQNANRNGLTGQINVLTEEDRKAKDIFCNALIADLKPETAMERQLAAAIADDHFRLNRIRSIENNIFALGHYGPAAKLDVDNAELHAALTSARVFLESAKELERLTLYAQRIRRDISRDTAELNALQAQRKAERQQALAETAQLSRTGESDLTHPNGFVFSNKEIKLWIRRHEALKECKFRADRNWDPDIEYQRAA